MSVRIKVGVVYRHPSQLASDIEFFSFKVCDIFSNLSSKKRTFYALGDFNLDLFKINNSNNVRKHIDIMMSAYCI